MTNYIIDFERINQLTMHPKDKESDMTIGTGVLSPHGVSRKIIKEYIEIYNQYLYDKHKTRSSNAISDQRFQMVVDTLLYNGILIDKRDKRIEQVLDPI